MTRPRVWQGKLNHVENKCPHCGAVDEYSDVAKTVMELSAQHYKKCIKCQGSFVDTYLIVWTADDIEVEEGWTLQCRWEDEDQVGLFGELEFNGILDYDCDNPNEDDEYYDLIPNSIHFVMDEE